jgi:hypothetical protein
MMQYMGRENGEDYNSDFLVMLNTWEGAAKYFAARTAKVPQPIELARMLGWISRHATHRGGMGANNLAEACAAASSLVAAKHTAERPAWTDRA